MHRKSALIAPAGHFSRKREKIDGRPLRGRLYKPERAGRKEQQIAAARASNENHL